MWNGDSPIHPRPHDHKFQSLVYVGVPKGILKMAALYRVLPQQADATVGVIVITIRFLDCTGKVLRVVEFIPLLVRKIWWTLGIVSGERHHTYYALKHPSPLLSQGGLPIWGYFYDSDTSGGCKASSVLKFFHKNKKISKEVHSWPY